MKKIALILDSLDKIFPVDGNIHGGANRVAERLIEQLANSGQFEIDIITAFSSIEKPDYINNIYILGICPLGNAQLFFEKAKEIVDGNSYNAVLTSDLFAPFGSVLVHSHTLMYKNKNCKNFIERIIQTHLRKKRVEIFKSNFQNKNRKIFTVSKRVANDYIENLGFLKENVIYSYPGVDQREFVNYIPQKTFTFGIVAGNAINKGGYIFLFAVLLAKLTFLKFRVNMIVSKSNKCSLMADFVKFLGLKNIVNIFPEQSGMDDFYNSIDCLVVPSLNEAFGLVVTEAASYTKPSLVSSTAGASELIVNDDNGFIFKRKVCVLHSLMNLYFSMRHILVMPKIEFKKVAEHAFSLSTQYNWEKFAGKIISEIFD